MNWLAHLLGLDMTGRWYGFWSGFGSDLGEAGIIAGLAANVRKHNCHVHRCWRIGRHQVTGTTHVVCRRHHPDEHLTHERLLQQAGEAQE